VRIVLGCQSSTGEWYGAIEEDEAEVLRASLE
jgi:hypothetical protein